MASHDGNNSRVCFGSLADVTRRRAIAETNSAFLAGDARCDITRARGYWPCARCRLLPGRSPPGALSRVSKSGVVLMMRPLRLERALSLNPNSVIIVVQQGKLLTWLGRPAEGTEWTHRAMRLNPYHPQRFWSHLGRAQYTARLYADAIRSFRQVDNAGSCPSRFSRRVVGAVGKFARQPVPMLRRYSNGNRLYTVETFRGTLHYQAACG
jgi:hypothetical protein